MLPSARMVDLACQLIKQGTISYPNLVPYLEPSDSVIKGVSKRLS